MTVQDLTGKLIGKTIVGMEVDPNPLAKADEFLHLELIFEDGRSVSFDVTNAEGVAVTWDVEA
jgi:hypothetical protein